MIQDATQLYVQNQPEAQPKIVWKFAQDSVAAQHDYLVTCRADCLLIAWPG
jgi:hypothetical protein